MLNYTRKLLKFRRAYKAQGNKYIIKHYRDNNNNIIIYQHFVSIQCFRVTCSVETLNVITILIK